MPWKRMLAYIIGSVNEDLLRRIEYPLGENRVLRNQPQEPPTSSPPPTRAAGGRRNQIPQVHRHDTGGADKRISEQEPFSVWHNNSPGLAAT